MSPHTEAHMKTVDVTVTLTKTSNGVKATVDPFIAVIDLKDKINWALVSDYDDASMSIDKKNTNDDWPFDTNPPKDVKKGKSKDSGNMKTNPKKQTRYNIQCYLVDGTEPVNFVIDPDIIIIGGTLE